MHHEYKPPPPRINFRVLKMRKYIKNPLLHVYSMYPCLRRNDAQIVYQRLRRLAGIQQDLVCNITISLSISPRRCPNHSTI